MKKSLTIWGRCGLALMAAMAFAASAAPPPTDKVHEVALSSEYISSSKMVGKTAVGQVASTRVGAVVQPGNIAANSCSPTAVGTSKTVKNCGWGKKVVLGGVPDKVAISPPTMGLDATRAAGNSKINFYLKTTFAAGQGLRIGSPGLAGLDLLNTTSLGATASIITPAKDLDPVFGGAIATDSGANIA